MSTKSLKVLIFIFVLINTLFRITLANENVVPFSIKGIGNLSCTEFIEAKDNEESQYFQFGGWVEGYLSAYNQFSSQIFDVAPWQTTETLAQIVYASCKKETKVQFSTVVVEVARKLSQSLTLAFPSEIVIMKKGNYQVSIPKQILDVVTNKLYEGGWLSKADLHDMEAIKLALSKYQQDNNLPKTFLPDQFTLWLIIEGTAK